MSTFKYIELFGGIGGFRIGIENSSLDARCVDYIENDKYCVQQYNEYFKEDYEPRDIKELETEDIARHDILTAGFPCQSFSVAGQRKGFQDTRGTLFFEIARILQQKQPPFCILENVKGLLSHENGRTFQIILSTLDELGYDAEWQVLNSAHFGVPQNRERVFIIASLREQRVGQVFPISRESQEAAVEWAKQNIIEPATTQQKPRITHNAVTNAIGRQGSSREYKRSLEDVTKARAVRGELITRENAGRQDGETIRRLTPRECYRLQGFPDDYEINCSDTQAYSQAGNAVTASVVLAVAECLDRVFG